MAKNKIKYQELLKKLDCDESKLSKSVKAAVKKFKALHEDVLALEEEAASEDTTEERRAELQEQMPALHESMSAFDDELCAKIQHWYDNKDYYAAKVQNMQAKKDAKKAEDGSGSPTPEPPIPEPVPVPPAPAPPTSTVETPAETGAAEPVLQPPTPAEPAAQQAAEGAEVAAATTEEKRKTPWGWIGFGVLVVASIFVGANLAKKSS